MSELACPWYENLWYSLCRNLDIIQKYREVKWFFQRGKRGYADCDVWSLDWYLASWIPEAFREMKDGMMGYPSLLMKKGEMNTTLTKKREKELTQKWKNVLDKIADGFEGYRRWEDKLQVKTSDETKRVFRNMRKAGNLLGKYFGCFWN